MTSKPPVPGDKKRSKEKGAGSDFYSPLHRFSKLPPFSEPVVYEFTDDRALLHQYYRLRETMYRKMPFKYGFVGEEDVYDKLSYILIARRGKLCVGGCRLTVREADEDFLLPMEGKDFKLRSAFPELPLRQMRHSEVSRFAVLDEDDDHMDIMLALSKLTFDKCVNEDVAFSFIKSSLPMARNWRKIIQTHCGQKTVRIRTDISVPEYELCPEVKWYITEVPLPAAEATLDQRAVFNWPMAPIH